MTRHHPPAILPSSHPDLALAPEEPIPPPLHALPAAARFDLVRAQFPALRHTTYLDTACIGLAPQSAARAVTSLVEELSWCPAVSGTAHHSALHATRERARPLAAELLGTGPDDIALTAIDLGDPRANARAPSPPHRLPHQHQPPLQLRRRRHTDLHPLLQHDRRRGPPPRRRLQRRRPPRPRLQDSRQEGQPVTYLGSHQGQIFETGAHTFPHGADALERAARQTLEESAFAYISGAAGRERTAAANLRAFACWGLVYRVLREGAPVDTSIRLFDTPMAFPVLLAPAGVADLAHPGAEPAAARAAAVAGVTQVLSAATSTPLEQVAQAAEGGHRWFQFAWSSDERLARSLIDRAESAGYAALMLMGDCYVAGWRTRELDLGFFPFHHGHGMGNYLSDPRFRELAELPGDAAETGDPHAVRDDPALLKTVAATWNRVLNRPRLTVADLAVLRSWTGLPVIVKGVCDPGEALRLVEAGADGIVVSNHGGRQLDATVAALDCLPPIVDAVAGQVPILFDSGVRTGTDVLIALALGASAVMIGRPWLYGLAVGGQAGVEHVLRCLHAEFTGALTMTGHRRCATLSPADLTPLTPAGTRRETS